MPRTKMANRKLTFAVVYETDGSGWHAYIPDVKGCRTWGRSLSEARRHIREALATCEDVLGPKAAKIAEKAQLDEDVRLPARVRRKVARYQESKERVEAETVALRKATHAAATALTQDVGVSLRDAGELLGLSQERVRQVTSDA